MTNKNLVGVKLWGTHIGYLFMNSNGQIGFQYNKDFLSSQIEVSPIQMPLSGQTYVFTELSENTFHGLPGLVADSFPDKFGNTVLQNYLQSKGRSIDDLSPIERLCYTGSRGMGALEYEPAIEVPVTDSRLDITSLGKLASEILSQKEDVHYKVNPLLMAQLMQSSSSVGGARAKTVIAWNEKTDDIRSGQINPGCGYTHWLLKFDNIKNNKDKDPEPDNAEYTKIEYAYYLMAKDCSVEMNECRLYKENGLSHFMTKRFDRTEKGEKIHMQSLCALAHMDFNVPRIYSYEEAFLIMKKLGLSYNEIKQFYTRMVFNEFAKNYDDHTKNISFLMNKQGLWSLAPAYDITFAFKKNSIWTSSHQMLINGKYDGITSEDLMIAAKNSGVKKSDAIDAIDRVRNSVLNWKSFAQQAGVSEENANHIYNFLK